ncbi:cache domain-containing sensor histidine kinase [Ruminiclostridium cellobioparum]|uniref:histidine kinase n=1 Tax=Ruminiclostridium cellobioparum subsp. termitidis CT1112 TaxID=1195236 RepID=S0FKK4_RUMCE|nr:sensor histidine kinase [Ruminiclostridium cellobioparum]EMS69729.1 integral membrane sensor signal transduction histidine kinase [Ruminiclostridium cellobioparum subsp. termitidis CT1112]
MLISAGKKRFLIKIKESKMGNSFKKMSFKSKLIFSFIFVSIIPMLLVQSISYFNTTSAMKENVNELITYNLAQTEKNLNTTLNSYMDILYQIYTDDEIIELVKKINAETDSAMEISLLRDKLSKLTNSKEGIRSIAILSAGGKTAFYDTLTASSLDSSWMNKNFEKSEFYRDITSSKGSVLIPTSYASQLGDKKYYLFHIANKMVDFNDIRKDAIGVIVISIDEDIIYRACNEVDAKKEAKKSVRSVNFIVDKKGYIISFPDKDLIGANISLFDPAGTNGQEDGYTAAARKISYFDSSSIITNSLTSEKNGWIIVNAVDQSFLFSKVYMTQRLTITFGILALLFSIIIIFYVTRNFSGSIRKILHAMKTAQEGELSVRVELDDDGDEMSAIAARFNKMIYKINKLVEEVRAATFKQKEAEIRALEAQINPHFLYNTLDAINWMAIEKDEHEISNMLKSLAQILRYSVNKSNSIVKLREEIEWLKQYIYLQQTRFNYSFECFMEVDENVLDFNIHKLLFQPFIENVIIHGFEGINKGGVLDIGIKGRENSIMIVIRDNGKGIDPETVSKLNSPDDKEITAKGSGLGASNVFNRIKMYYGDSGSWQVESETGKGTTITLKIPKL